MAPADPEPRRDRAGFATGRWGYHADVDPAPVVITACPDGPLLVRGEVTLVSPDGKPLPRRRSTVALCRCGMSAIKPYCDGSHKVTGFVTDDEAVVGLPRVDLQPAEPDRTGQLQELVRRGHSGCSDR